MSKELMGCCGAYCQPCKMVAQQLCKGCKVGYAAGERDINKAKCKMKICCVKRGLVSCADCEYYSSCETLQSFYAHDSYKYKNTNRQPSSFAQTDMKHFSELPTAGTGHVAHIKAKSNSLYYICARYSRGETP